jgi:hypothetical protein
VAVADAGAIRATVIQPSLYKPVHPLLREFVRCARAYADQALAGAASSSATS